MKVAFTRSIVNELHSWHIQGDGMEGEGGVTRIIINERHSRDVLGDLMERESGVTGSIMDELHSWNIQRDQMEGKVVFLEISLVNFILRISKEIK